MKTIYILFVTSLLLALSSCEMRDELRGNAGSLDEGVVQFSMGFKDPVIVTRAGGFAFPSEEINVNNYTIRIQNSDNDDIKYESDYADLIADGGKVTLPKGNYRVVGFNYERPENQGASLRPYFKGESTFQILAGTTTNVSAVCRLQDFGVYLVLSDDFIAELKDDYIITVTNTTNGNYIFTKENITDVAYFAVPESKKSIGLSLKATTKSGLPVEYAFTFGKEDNEDIGSNEVYKVTMVPGDEPSVEYGTRVDWDIKVDLTMNDTGVTIEIPTEKVTSNPGGETGENKGPIVVTGLGEVYNITESVVSEEDDDSENGEEDLDIPTVVVDLHVPNGIQNLIVEIKSDSDTFNEIIAGQMDEPFDLANLEGNLAVFLETIGLVNSEDPIKDKTEYTFDITDFVALLKSFPGQHVFTITVADGINPDETGDVTINVTPAVE